MLITQGVQSRHRRADGRGTCQFNIDIYFRPNEKPRRIDFPSFIEMELFGKKYAYAQMKCCFLPTQIRQILTDVKITNA